MSHLFFGIFRGKIAGARILPLIWTEKWTFSEKKSGIAVSRVVTDFAVSKLPKKLST